MGGGGGHKGECTKLKSCYIECLKLAKKYKCKTVAFPLISSGNYGYPKDEALSSAVEIINGFLYENEMTVFLCVYDKTSYNISKQLFKDIREFIKDEDVFAGKCSTETLKNDLRGKRIFNSPKYLSCQDATNLKDYLKDYLRDMDKSFIETLFDYIDSKGLTDVQCYKKANVDRKTFNKLKNNPKQKPAKQTAVAFAIALKLTLEETLHLLETAGLTLSNSNVFDKIIRYFLINGKYDLFEINEALFEFDQVLLG